MGDLGRPPIQIDFNQLKALMRLKPTLNDAAAFFQCSPDTIERRIKENTVTDEFPDGLTFAAFRDQNMVHTRFSIIRKIITKAEAGDNIMLIYASKNLCDWSDGKVADVKVDVHNHAAKSDDDVNKRFDELLAKATAKVESEDEPEGEAP